jgi:hypothetical protein
MTAASEKVKEKYVSSQKLQAVTMLLKVPSKVMKQMQ